MVEVVREACYSVLKEVSRESRVIARVITLHQDIPYEGQAQNNVIFHAFQPNIILKPLHTRLWKRVAVNIVKHVHNYLIEISQ